jgi:hypothetical protein
MNAYSTAGAIGMSQQNLRGGVVHGVLHGLWKFLRGYVLRAGFLDGRYGFLAAVSNAENTYYKYAKRWLMDELAANEQASSTPLTALPEADVPPSGRYAHPPSSRTCA